MEEDDLQESYQLPDDPLGRRLTDLVNAAETRPDKIREYVSLWIENRGGQDYLETPRPIRC